MIVYLVLKGFIDLFLQGGLDLRVGGQVVGQKAERVAAGQVAGEDEDHGLG